MSLSRGFGLQAVCSFLLRAVPALWTGDISKYLVGRHCHECVISTYLTNLPWNHSHNLHQNYFVCLWRQSDLAKGLVMQTTMSRCHPLAHHHPSAEQQNCLCACLQLTSAAEEGVQVSLPNTSDSVLCRTRAVCAAWLQLFLCLSSKNWNY